MMSCACRSGFAVAVLVAALSGAAAGCGGGSGGASEGDDRGASDAGADAAAGTDARDGSGAEAGLDVPPERGTDADAETDSGSPGPLDLVGYVDPFIGTDDSNSPNPVPGGAGGSTCPGAVVPFGMVQLSPDTPTASPSGYRFSDTEIEQFSLTHLDGAGCPNDEDLPFLPIVGELAGSPGTNWYSYRSGYAKSSEVASPGYYRVDLDRYGVRTELTATTRTGMARFTYPATTSARVLVHTGRSATGMRNGTLELMPPDRLRGTIEAGGFCWSLTGFQIHFVMVFDRPWTGGGTWLGAKVSPGSAGVTGEPSGGYVVFDTTSDPVVQVKIGLSYVSVENAQANLDAENPGWDFDAVRDLAAEEWNEVLNRIQVTGGSDEDLRKFYTALYHVFQNPNVASDVNGEYMGFDGKAHSADRVTYQNFSGWDIIRSWTHLAAAVAPEGPDIIGSMVQDGIEAGLLPFWTHQNVETHVMVGDPGTVNVANAYAMGVRGFDADAALLLMKESADNPAHTQRWGLDNWINLHFAGNAAISLEYAMADFALAQFAQALGDTAAHKKYMARSDYWKESWHPQDKYIEPKVAGSMPGAWDCQPFDPAAECGFIEGNAAQYVWMVPHNLEGLFGLMGGHPAALARLDDLFTELNAGTKAPYFYIGNEPEHGTPWTYNFALAPWKTQEVVRRIVDQEFNTSPGGLPGNDDLGATSAWLVWAYLGLYPVIPGMDVLVLNGPRFPSSVVHLANGNLLTINASGAGADAPFIQSLQVNGTSTTKSWLRFSDISGGATLDYAMGATPNADWGSAPADAPPSFSPEESK